MVGSITSDFSTRDNSIAQLLLSLFYKWHVWLFQRLSALKLIGSVGAFSPGRLSLEGWGDFLHSLTCLQDRGLGRRPIEKKNWTASQPLQHLQDFRKIRLWAQFILLSSGLGWTWSHRIADKPLTTELLLSAKAAGSWETIFCFFSFLSFFCFAWIQLCICRTGKQSNTT